MLEDEEFAVRKQGFALPAAVAAFLCLMLPIAQAQARPGGSGWGAGKSSWGGARLRAFHHGRRTKFHRRGFVAAEIGSYGGRYLSDDAWFLSDIGGYLADDPAYPDFGSYSHGYGYAYPVYPRRVGYGFRTSGSYAVPVHRAAHASRRVVRVHRGAPNRGIDRAAFRPGRHDGY